MLERGWREAQGRLAGLARLAEQLHPDRPLARGYVRVTAANGATITTRALAAGENTLDLHFADGTLAVSTGTSPAARPRPRSQGAPTRQEDLFG